MLHDDDCFHYFKNSLILLIEGLCSSDSSSWSILSSNRASSKATKLFLME